MIQIFTYGYMNPLYSIIVVGIAIFSFALYIFHIPRDKKPLNDSIARIEALKADLQNYRSESKLQKLNEAELAYKIAKRNYESNFPCFVNILLVSLAFSIPLYFLWMPILIMLSPIALAYMVFEHKKIFGYFTGKNSVDKAESTE